MNFTYLTSILYLVILGIHVFMQLAATSLIFIKHHTPNNRTWYYIFVFFAVSAISSIIEMVMAFENTNILESYKLFSPIIIIPGFYIFFLIWCYIAELMRPHWLTVKRTILILLPSLLVALPITILSLLGETSNIYSTAQLRVHISEFNVYIRIAFVALFLPYCIGLIHMRNKHKNPDIQKYIDLLTTCLVLMVCSYIASRCMQYFIGYIIHEVFYLMISVFIVYAEHYERLHVPLAKVREYYHAAETTETTQHTINQVAQKLQELMDKPEIWQDPELTGDKIVHIVGTNRTYIQQAAKDLGFVSLSDMLHRRRINYVCQRLNQSPNANVQDLFYDAGYRSRATAWRHFTKIVGCTPSEFIKLGFTPPPVEKYKLLIFNYLQHERNYYPCYRIEL